MTSHLVLKPRLSEKAYGLSQSDRTYVFQVPLSANKLTIAAAVEQQFGVHVETVNCLKLQGKVKRTYVASQRKYVKGTRNDIKKAYVRLAEGESIPIFAADEEAEAKQQDQTEKLTKVAERAEKKASKKAKKDKE